VWSSGRLARRQRLRFHKELVDGFVLVCSVLFRMSPSRPQRSLEQVFSVRTPYALDSSATRDRNQDVFELPWARGALNQEASWPFPGSEASKQSTEGLGRGLRKAVTHFVVQG
jgi:hypothetical protein